MTVLVQRLSAMRKTLTESAIRTVVQVYNDMAGSVGETYQAFAGFSDAAKLHDQRKELAVKGVLNDTMTVAQYQEAQKMPQEGAIIVTTLVQMDVEFATLAFGMGMRGAAPAISSSGNAGLSGMATAEATAMRTTMNKGATVAAEGITLTQGAMSYGRTTIFQRESMYAVPDMKDFTDVFIHGNKKSLSLDNKNISVDQLASMLRRDNVRGQIRLFSCYSGTNGAAQELANKLGVAVLAPSHGAIRVEDGVIIFLETGATWKKFLPQF